MCQKQVLRAGTCNYTPSIWGMYSRVPAPSIPASGTQVYLWCTLLYSNLTVTFIPTFINEPLIVWNHTTYKFHRLASPLVEIYININIRPLTIVERPLTTPRWVALTLISWGTTLISSVQHWSSEETGWKCWVNTFPPFFPISLHFFPIKSSLSSAQYVSTRSSTVAFRAHDVISRELLPQICDNTDTVRSASIFRKLLNSAGLNNVHEIFLYHSLSVSI